MAPGRDRRSPKTLAWAAAVLAGIWGFDPASALAQDVEAPPPQVDLDQLLKLPGTSEYTFEKKGGYTRGEWRERFNKLRGGLELNRKALRDAEDRLVEKSAGTSAWQMAAPGLPSNPDAPLDFQLKREIDQRRVEIERLEGMLRELEVEANLAGIPEDWRS